MIKLTVLQLLNSGTVIKSLSQQKLTGLAALRIRRLVAKLVPEMRAAEEARNTLLTEENSIPMADGGKQVKPECVPAFLAAPLFKENLEIDVLPLTPADLADAQLSVQDLDFLGPLFVDDGSEDRK